MERLFHNTSVRTMETNELVVAEAEFLFAATLTVPAGRASEAMEWWMRREYARCRDELSERKSRK